MTEQLTRPARHGRTDPGRMSPLVARIAALTHNTPFLGIDLGEISAAYDALSDALPEGTDIHYAMKCQSDPSVLQTINRLGGRFEIASMAELALLTNLGISVDRVLFSNPVKAEGDIARAYASGVDRFAFDSTCEVDKLALAARGAAVYVRLATGATNSDVPSEGKFGVTVDAGLELMLHAAERGLIPHGISCHVGSQQTDITAWTTAIERAADLMRRLQRHGITLTLLDLGGGFPVRYDEAVPHIAEIGASITRALAHLPYPVRLAVEPGRYLAAPAGVMAATVIGIADRGGARWVHLDVGAYNGFIEALQTRQQLAFPISDGLSQAATQRVNLTGPSCDSTDTILCGVEVSAELEVGDRVFISNAGAYTQVYGSFCGQQPPTVYALDAA